MHVISSYASWHIYNYVYTIHNSLQIDGDDDDDDDDDGAGGGGDVMIYIMKDAAIKQRETNIINADAFLTSTSSSAKHVSHFESASNSFTTTGFIKTATLQHFALVSTSSQVRKPYDFNSEGSHASKICGCTKDLATDMGIFHLFVVFFCCKNIEDLKRPTFLGQYTKDLLLHLVEVDFKSKYGTCP